MGMLEVVFISESLERTNSFKWRQTHLPSAAAGALGDASCACAVVIMASSWQKIVLIASCATRARVKRDATVTSRRRHALPKTDDVITCCATEV